MKAIEAKKELYKTIKREGLIHKDGTVWSKKATDYVLRLIANDMVNENLINNNEKLEDKNYKTEIYINHNAE